MCVTLSISELNKRTALLPHLPEDKVLFDDIPHVMVAPHITIEDLAGKFT